MAYFWRGCWTLPPGYASAAALKSDRSAGHAWATLADSTGRLARSTPRLSNLQQPGTLTLARGTPLICTSGVCISTHTGVAAPFAVH